MASAAPPLPIYYNPDVHDFYTKQKQEFHFQQKSDNEFMLFLLDTAVRVISIVQHLAPVIEAVSDANTDVEDDDDVSQTVTPTVTLSDPGNMEVDSTQIPLNTGILPTLRTQSFADRTQIPDHPDPTHISSQNIVDHSVSQSTKPVMQRATTRSTSKLSAVLAPSDLVGQEEQPNVPTKHQPSSGQASHNIPTSVSHSSQPVAEPANVDYKMEDTPDVIEIKEEMEEAGAPSNEMLTPENLQQLMTSISGVDGSVQNFVPTATSLPPLLLDRNANNSLSMVGSRGGPGPAGLTLPDTLMKSITEGGIKLTDMKGASNSTASRRRRVTNLSIDAAVQEYNEILAAVATGKALSVVLQEKHVDRSHFFRRRCIAEAALADRAALEAAFRQLKKVTLANMIPHATRICNSKMAELSRLFAEGRALRPKARY